MAGRKLASEELSVKASVDTGLDRSKVRDWSAVAGEIQKLREGGASVPEICEKLEVSYVLVNQCVLQSYKIAVDSAQVFERQEKMRLEQG